MASNHGRVAHLLPAAGLQKMVTAWLEEDCPTFDHGGFVVGEHMAEAKLLGKGTGVVAGIPFFDEVFHQLDCTVEWYVKEGEMIKPIKHCATVRGPVRKVLLGERVALNCLARCSGIATKTSALLNILDAASGKYPSPILAGTRKTTPGFRVPEKYAMLVGGADPHRHDLSTMTMLKDNHIVACKGSIPSAVAAAKSVGGFSIKTEVECQSEEEANHAVEAGADVIMLDNFDMAEVGDVGRRLKEKWRGSNKSFLIEVSGGITESNVRSLFKRKSDEGIQWQDMGGWGVDVISTSSIHQGVGHVDFSLKIVKQ